MTAASIIDGFADEGSADANADAARTENPYQAGTIAGDAWDLGWSTATILKALPRPVRWVVRGVWKAMEMARRWRR